MSDNEVKVQVGPGFPALLFLVFLALKLTDVIAWSWWWVTAPLWGPVALVTGIGLLAGLGFGFYKLVTYLCESRIKRSKS